jgi:signal recognition particle subunit SRP54
MSRPGPYLLNEDVIPEVTSRQRVAPAGAISVWLTAFFRTPQQPDWTDIMFDTLSDRLSGIFDGLTKRGALSEKDVNEALREVRRALLEADVALEVVRAFVEQVRARAVGVEVLKSVSPGQQVIKIVHDELVAVLGSEAQTIDLASVPPVPILMVGLQGSGKTTTTAKIAKRLVEREKKKVLMASLDTRRPAAMEQLRVLGEQLEVPTLPIVEGQSAVQIAKRAMEAARLGGHDVVLLDTAGRTTVDEALMAETAEIEQVAKPHEVLLVVDALTGQDAVNTARAFDQRLDVTGIVLTRVDGDGRGGAALAMRAVTGKPIKLIGTGEKVDALEEFHPQRIAGRILGQGDIVSLVEKAAQDIDQEKAAKMAKRLQKGAFDLNDLKEQMQQMQKLGGMGGLMGMMPGIGKMKKQIDQAGIDDKAITRQIAIIQSMTPKERAKPDVLKASRKKRIAAGSGMQVADVNKLLKMHRQMADMMKAMGKKKGGMLGGLFGGGMPSPDEIAAAQAAQGGGDAGGAPNLDPDALAKMAQQAGGGLPGLGAPGGLPGLGGGLPGMPGLPGLGVPQRGGKKKKRK